MKTNEILHALKLTKSKETTIYCTKLANVFEFVKLVKDNIIDAAIIENDLTIDCNGKLLHILKIESSYKEALLNKYKFNDAAINAIEGKESKLRCENAKLADELYKKRKNKDNSILQSQKDAIVAELQELNKEKVVLIDNEELRLKTIVTDIVEMRKELNLFTGASVMLQTNTGNYTFYVPIDNQFYYTIFSQQINSNKYLIIIDNNVA